MLQYAMTCNHVKITQPQLIKKYDRDCRLTLKTFSCLFTPGTLNCREETCICDRVFLQLQCEYTIGFSQRVSISITSESGDIGSSKISDGVGVLLEAGAQGVSHLAANSSGPLSSSSEAPATSAKSADRRMVGSRLT